jgi:uncharacterized protein
VRAALGRADQAVVRATAHPIGHPILEGARVGRSPPAVVLEPVMRGSDGVCRAAYHLRKDNDEHGERVRGLTGEGRAAVAHLRRHDTSGPLHGGPPAAADQRPTYAAHPTRPTYAAHKRRPDASGPDTAPNYDRHVRLSREEARVIGSLVEKQLTTPQQYPLTMNALVLACNQSSNRDPVVELDERTVDNALVSLKAAGLVRFVHPSHGRSATRYQHVLGEQLGLTEQQLALVAVLLLRGPQTGGELRSRTERMCEFEGITQVDLELERLSGLPEPVVVRLPRQPGQKEERWVHLLTDSPLAVPEQPLDEQPPGGANAGLAAEVAELRAQVAELREELEKLRRDLYG